MLRPYLALFLLFSGNAWAQRARLSLVPEAQVVAVGDTLQVRVEVETQGLPLTSASVFLSLDAEVFAPLSPSPFAPGEFLPGQVYDNSVAWTTGGEALLSYVTVSSAGNEGKRLAASGKGELARFRVRAIAPGETQIRVEGSGPRRSIYTEQGAPGVERRFQLPAARVGVRVEGDGPVEIPAIPEPAQPEAPLPEEVGPAVPPANAPPAIAALEPLAVAMGGESYGPLLAGVVQDVDHEWEELVIEVEGDSVVAARIEGGRIAVRGLQAGQGQVEVRVRDPAGGEARAVLMVEVREAGQGPILRPLPRQAVTVGEEQVLRLEEYVSDPDTPLEALRWEVAVRGGLEVWLEGRALRLRGAAPGPARIDLQVADPQGNVAAAALAVQVEEEAPIPASGGEESGGEVLQPVENPGAEEALVQPTGGEQPPVTQSSGEVLQPVEIEGAEEVQEAVEESALPDTAGPSVPASAQEESPPAESSLASGPPPSSADSTTSPGAEEIAPPDTVAQPASTSVQGEEPPAAGPGIGEGVDIALPPAGPASPADSSETRAGVGIEVEEEDEPAAEGTAAQPQLPEEVPPLPEPVELPPADTLAEAAVEEPPREEVSAPAVPFPPVVEEVPLTSTEEPQPPAPSVPAAQDTDSTPSLPVLELEAAIEHNLIAGRVDSSLVADRWVRRGDPGQVEWSVRGGKRVRAALDPQTRRLYLDARGALPGREVFFAEASLEGERRTATLGISIRAPRLFLRPLPSLELSAGQEAVLSLDEYAGGDFSPEELSWEVEAPAGAGAWVEPETHRLHLRGGGEFVVRVASPWGNRAEGVLQVQVPLPLPEPPPPEPPLIAEPAIPEPVQAPPLSEAPALSLPEEAEALVPTDLQPPHLQLELGLGQGIELRVSADEVLAGLPGVAVNGQALRVEAGADHYLARYTPGPSRLAIRAEGQDLAGNMGETVVEVVAQRVGPAGDRVRSGDGRLQVQFPLIRAEALVLIYEEEGAYRVDFAPERTGPAELVFACDTPEPPAIHRWGSSTWEELPTSALPGGGLVYARSEGPGRFKLGGRAAGVLPESPLVYPNPFNARAAIRYQVGEKGPVRVRVWDLQGRQIRLLVEQVQERGVWTAQWDGLDAGGREAASGVYFYEVEAGGQRWAGKLSLVR